MYFDTVNLQSTLNDACQKTTNTVSCGFDVVNFDRKSAPAVTAHLFELDLSKLL